MTAHNTILLAAGGTGGHMFPASALAEKLQNEGYDVRLATDSRGMAYVDRLVPMHVHKIPAATIYTGGVLALPMRMLTLIWSLLAASYLIIRVQPKVVIGFGGYPSFGPVMAGLLLRRPVLVHEQNAVLGRVNRLAARFGASIATSYAKTGNVPTKAAERMRRTGNPLRPAVLKAAQGGYRYLTGSRPFDLLIFGGSQGAAVFANVLPKAVAGLPENLQRRLRIVHQVRKEQMRTTLDAYGEIGVYAEIRDFFSDLPTRMRRAHLVIARGGAGTVAEICALGAPSIIVPLPGSLDQDQANNIRELASAGGAIMMKQNDFSAARLSDELQRLMTDEEALQAMSKSSADFGELDAVGRLGRYSVCLAEGRPVQIEKPKEEAAEDMKVGANG
ncbi:MAG: undecaprenyldiphospho-muramoylpentapeptide beta-N-acetylglucosaminyltransferase [Parvibaculales bacterium]